MPGLHRGCASMSTTLPSLERVSTIRKELQGSPPNQEKILLLLAFQPSVGLLVTVKYCRNLVYLLTRHLHSIYIYLVIPSIALIILVRLLLILCF